MRIPAAPRETIENDKLYKCRSSRLFNWTLRLCNLSSNFPILSSQHAKASLVVTRTAIEIVNREFSARFGDSIFTPTLTELSVRRWAENRGQYELHTYKLDNIFEGNILQFRISNKEQLALPVHATNMEILQLIEGLEREIDFLQLIHNMSLFPELLSMHIASNKLCLHRLLFIENLSCNKDRPDCFPAFFIDHAQRGFSITAIINFID